jgi:hypothetical protein
MITVSIIGLTGSDTKACRLWHSIGSFSPAMAASLLEPPVAHRPTRSAPMSPLVVFTPTTLPPTILRPVTSQFWITSTPSASAARA